MRPAVHVIFFGEVTLVEREGGAATGVDVEERVTYGDVAEGFDEGNGVGVVVDGDGGPGRRGGSRVWRRFRTGY